MGPKLLFFFGIVVTHGAVGAVLLRHDSPITPTPIASCVQPSAPLPYFVQQREMLAMVVIPIDEQREVERP